MAKSLFLGKAHSIAYSRFRPTPPQQIFDRILNYVKEKIPSPLMSAVDVGCGSGQSTLPLCAQFQHVLGTDISQAQLSQARRSAEGINNVAYSIARAEELPVENGTVQLITASQCFHWFDAENFYTEAKRILVPNGVLAVYAYKIPLLKSGNTVLDQMIHDQLMKLYTGALDSYWDPARHTIMDGYKKVCLPFKDVQRIDSIWASKHSSIEEYEGYLSTWSGYQSYVKAKGQEAGRQLLQEFSRRIMEILQSPRSKEETILKVDTEYFMLMGRN